ncbi:MAG: SDR family oxidoreductase [Synechococcus sp. SB0676_bin_10]|uniref:SDR family oxidoreductase n=1 Tax=Synechococcus sp. SB0676_bin_10 TaxID=2604869 RepID=A0A6B1FCU2_9SYNE|nr:SDR family oxidoreductase [Synechococcus sp. SB0676_bin_10]MYK07811.1 SDR family oxidoreductase [Synechococcus sp. SB0670_bin_20]
MITGASRGIGAATARCFAARGWALQLLARDGSALAAMAGDLRRQGAVVHWAAVDLSEADDVPAGVETLLASGGAPGVLINNAGVGYTAPLATMSLQDWRWLVQLNLTSVLQVTQTALPGMRLAGGGLIINISSHAADQAFPEWGGYGMTKAALAAFSRSLALEEASQGIRVTTVTLGAVNTPLWDTPTVHADLDRRAMLDPDNVAHALLQLAEQPPKQRIENLTLLPAAGAL